MNRISESTEKKIQQALVRAKGEIIDDAIVYMIGGPYETIRYVEGDRHITGGFTREFISEPWYYWYSTIARELFTPKRWVVSLSSPVRWDNEDSAISDDQLKTVLDRIERAVLKRAKRCRIELVANEKRFSAS